MASPAPEDRATFNEGKLRRLLTPRRLFWMVIAAIVVAVLLGPLTIGIYKLGVDAQRARIARIEQYGGHLFDARDERNSAFTPGKLLGPAWDPPPVTALSIDQPAGPQFPALVKEASSFRGLRLIRLEGTPLTDEQLQSLVNPRAIRVLVIPGTDVTDRGIERLVNCSQLEGIDLRLTQISDSAITSLAKIKTLQHVDLRHTRVTAAGAARLQAELPSARIFGATAPTEAHMAALREIGWRGGIWQSREYYYDGLDENIGVAFDQHGNWLDFDWAKLKTIDGLSYVYIEAPTTTTPLTTIAELPTIKRLDLDKLTLDQADIDLIGQMTTLESLSLVECQLDWSSMHQTLNRLKNIRSLLLKGTPIDSASLETFTGLPKLTSLSLSQCPCDNEALARVGLPDQLETLMLSETQVSDVGLQGIRPCRSLRFLDLSKTPVTDASADVILALPALETAVLYHSQMSRANISIVEDQLRARTKAPLRGPSP